jgi:capsular polysaccharide export protein
MPAEKEAPRLVASTGNAPPSSRPERPLPAIAADGLFAFRNRNILMLQGPVGPFFARLAQDLSWAGARVHKINFNGGDWAFFPRGATSYRGTVQDFPEFLEQICREKRIEIIMLFGDCRPIHYGVRPVAERLGVRVEVFEEGYVRPDYITMETHGVNGHSALPRSPIFYLNTPAPAPASPMPTGASIWHAGVWACLYYLFAGLFWLFFPRYVHHRTLSWIDGLRWVRGWCRKHLLALTSDRLMDRLLGESAPPFFLVPLQVHNDAQVRVHSGYEGVRDFIEHVVASFAEHAPAETVLAFKHHPMDRAYSNYRPLLRSLAIRHGVRGRILYLHDEHLPTLLSHARGVVTINSTTGMSAIHRNCPTLVLGDAIYRIDGLTASCTLDSFWTDAERFPVHRELYRRFRAHLIHRTQINGNFYRRMNIPGSLAGLNWARGDEAQ